MIWIVVLGKKLNYWITGLYHNNNAKYLSYQQMLSTKYQDIIFKFWNEKSDACTYDEKQTIRTYDMTNAYGDVFQNLRELSQNNILGTDQYCYANCINNSILGGNVWNNGRNAMTQQYIDMMRQLDYMKDDSKRIINMCLGAIDINFIADDNIFNKICQECSNANTVLSQVDADRISETIVLKIHFNVLLCKIFFVWKSNQQLYYPDVMKYIELVKIMSNTGSNLNPYNNYAEFRSSFYNIFSAQKERVKDLFQYMELLAKNYKSVVEN